MCLGDSSQYHTHNPHGCAPTSDPFHDHTRTQDDQVEPEGAV